MLAYTANVTSACYLACKHGVCSNLTPCINGACVTLAVLLLLLLQVLRVSVNFGTATGDSAVQVTYSN
jgi:hypothetical protein